MNEFHNKNHRDAGPHRITANPKGVHGGRFRPFSGNTFQTILHSVLGPADNPPHLAVHPAGNSAKNGRLFTHQCGRLGNNKISPGAGKLATHNSPVSMISGEVSLNHTDFHLPGPIPMLWNRTYRSSHNEDLGLGAGWTAPYLARLVLEEQTIHFADGEGRRIPFLRPTQDNACFNTQEQLTLYRRHDPLSKEDAYAIVDHNAIERRFGGPGDIKLLRSIHAGNRYYLRFHYNENGRLTHLSDNAGRQLKLEYNLTDRLRTVHLLDENQKALGKSLVQYHYNGEGDLISVTDAGGNAQTFHYQNHVLRKHTNKDGFNHYFQWDQEDIYGKCLHYWAQDNIRERRITYDEANKITRCTDGCGNTTELQYNEWGLVTRQIDAQGGVWGFDYDSDGRLLRERDPMGNTVQYGYNSDSKLIRVVNPMGHTTRFDYDDEGRLTGLTDALGMRWRRRYDASGRLTAIVDPQGYAVQYQYDEFDNPTVITNAMRRSQRLDWSNYGRLLAIADAAGNRREFAYDAVGRVTEIRERDQIRRFSYDPMGRVIQMANSKGDTLRLEYTPEGNLARYTDASGNSTSYVCDGMAQILERTNSLGQSFKYGYDKERNLTAMQNENGERYEFHYDNNHRLISEIGFDRRQQHYGYNTAGHLVSHTDGANRITQFKRDALGRIIKKWSSDQDISRYEYDPLGRLIQAVNKDADLEYKFSDNGQLIEERQNNSRLRHEYDLNNQRTATLISKTERIDYEFNAQGFLKKVSYNNKPLTGITRNIQGQEIIRTSGAVNSVFAYDAMGRLIHHGVTKDRNPLLERNYAYDAMGNLQQMDDIRNGKVVFKYDALNRLRAVSGAAAEQFNYDPSNNLLDARQAFAGGRVRGNRILVYLDYRFEYDDAGNLIAETKGKKQTHYEYNTQNQLIKAEKNDQIFHFAYDPLGRRVKKTGQSGESTFLWDGLSLLGERRNHQQIIYIHEPGSARPLYQIHNGGVYYYHNDHLGSPIMLTDTNGKIVWHARYKAHGAFASAECSDLDNAIGFRGWYYDRETGLYYNGVRYFHPVIGRFIHQAPCESGRVLCHYDTDSQPTFPEQFIDLHHSPNPLGSAPRLPGGPNPLQLPARLEILHSVFEQPYETPNPAL